MPRKGNDIKSKAVNVSKLGKADPKESEIDNLFGNIIKADIRHNGIKTVSRSKIMKALGS